MNDTNLRQDQLSPVKQALIKVQEMRAELDEIKYRRHEPIAIIGVGLRFPGGAKDLDSYRRLLLEGFDAISEVPSDRWDIEAFYDPDPEAPGKMYSRHGGFLDQVDRFDPGFFGISPREAANMDPQQRILLEVGWEAIEHAGYGPDQLAESSTGIFLAINNSDYFRMLLTPLDRIDAYSTTGNAASITASRLAYFLNLKGPSIAIDTACSSSLVALHLAVQSLRSGESSMALVGAVNLILTPEITINFCKSRMLAADGKCKTFDAAADGYVRGEGCAMMVVKRLSDARADGDHVLALIRGSAINQDGRSGGITAPNGPAQEAVILAALKDAGVKPDEIDYVEAHGTATTLGDPIETRALGAIFGRGRPKNRRLVIGSVKTNIGHLEAAAGMAGLIKAALALKYGEIPPHLHLKQVNPHIPLDELGLAIPTETMPWPASEGPRMAGVSSFGLSGTNAQVVLESPEEEPPPQDAPDRPLHVLALSAKGTPELEEIAKRFDNHIATHRSESFADVCFTANTGRAHFNHRLAIVAESTEQAREGLFGFSHGRKTNGFFYGAMEDDVLQPKIAFLFTGQGAQHEGMGRRLFETEPLFREALQRCEEFLLPYLDQKLLRVMYPSESSAASLLDDTVYAQPALFSLEYALMKLWQSWGVKPAAVMGHSLGEYAAACAAGVFSLENGLKFVAQRARLAGSPPTDGGMAVVFADQERVAAAIAPFGKDLSLAAINGATNTVISGTSQAIDAATAKFEAEGVSCKRLNISCAFHSPLLGPILEPFEEVAAEIKFSKPRIALISNLTAQPVTGEEMCRPDYWRRHLCEPVRFSESIATLIRQGFSTFVEIGPRPVLLGMARPLVPEDSAAWLPSLRTNVDDSAQMLESLSLLYIRGAKVDWEGFDRGRSRRRLPLPTYPFQRARYWLDQREQRRSERIPDPSAIWQFVVDSGRCQANQGPLDLRVETYPDKWRRLEHLTTAYITRTLLQLGVFKDPNEAYSVDEVLQRFAILPNYHKLLSRWLLRLTRMGLLRLHERRFKNPEPLEMPFLDQRLKEAGEAFADQTFFLDYIERCGNMLADILTGRQDPLETLFPGGSSELAERLYGDWVVSRQISGIAASVVTAVVSGHVDARPLRILELGAGTGGTTGTVLRMLPPRPIEYWFTDVSEFFFIRAQEKYQDYPFVRYGALDIERNPLTQGFPSGSFDVVLATNVLHATLNLETAVDHVLTLLTPRGVLILSEITEDFAWLDITTGLIEGWQRFEDTWRKDSPLLSPQQWKEALMSRGFEDVQTIPEAGSASEVLGQHVIVARAPFRGQIPGTVPAIDSISTAAPTRFDNIPKGTERPSLQRSDEFLQRVMDALPQERHEIVVDCVRTQLAGVLRLDSAHLPNRRGRLLDMGIDSLMAVELRNRLSAVMGLRRKLPATLVFDYPTAEAIAGFLEREFLDICEKAKPEPEQRSEATAGRTITSVRIAQMSDEQVESMLLERLKKKQEAKE
jgi:acyl transferase domain-containing protein/SAM-dependent methyltransferase